MCGDLFDVRLRGSCNQDSWAETRIAAANCQLETSYKTFLSSSWHTEKAAVSNLFPFPLCLPGQGALTLHCLQRTPDQTITLSGSQPAQTAPKGSDSTDKLAPALPSHCGERERKREIDWGPPESRDSIVFLKLPSFSSSVLNGPLPHSSLLETVWNWQGEPNSRRKYNGWKCALFSPHSSVWHCDNEHILDSLWWSL